MKKPLVIGVVAGFVLVMLTNTPINAKDPQNWMQVQKMLAQSTATYKPAKYKQENVLQHFGGFGYINNNNALNRHNTRPKYPKSPKRPSISPRVPAEVKKAVPARTIKAEKGFPYTFKTYLIPPTVDYVSAYDFSSIQGMTKIGKYFYLFKTVGTNGSIVRIDEKVANIEAAGGFMLGNLAVWLSKPAATGCKNFNDYPCSEVKKFVQYIKYGPKFPLNGSHGGSLSNDGKNLWITLEPNDDPYVGDAYQKLVKIDANTLRARKEYSYKMSNRADNGWEGKFMIKNVAFTAPGKFVGFWNASDGYWFYTGTVNEKTNKVSIKASQNVINHPIGWAIQNISYNKANKQVYLVSDASIASFPLSVLTDKNSSKLKGRIRYTTFKTNREFEGLTFDANGKNMYLFVYQGAEIMKASTNSTYPFDITVSLSDSRFNSILWLMGNKISVGTNDGGVTKYNPKNVVNRGAMAEFMRKLVASPATTKPVPKITDISKLATARRNAIKWLASEKITLPQKNKYNPTGTVNRGAMAEFMYKLAGMPKPDPTTADYSKITDISELSRPRRKAIAWLAKNEITVLDNGKYNPQNTVNRGAMAEFMRKLNVKVLTKK
ncbi:MAG: S-layer homology domain-containing protein [Bifidobacteriaceae bacterium]|jgi:hypothetical protein|nr:S-layer homology domain-containing protein [Bifidobacteriaceae bacterium]